MRSANVDLLQHLRRVSLSFKSGQRRNISFLARQNFKLLLLTRSFLLRPTARRVTRERFDTPDSSRNRFFLYDPERTNFTCRSYVRATAELHRVPVELMRRPADLQNAHRVAVFFSEELDDVFSLPHLSIRNLCP